MKCQTRLKTGSLLRYLVLFLAALYFLGGSCSAEQAYLMTQTQLNNSRQELTELSQINGHSKNKLIDLQSQLTISKQQTEKSNSQLAIAKQQLTTAYQLTTQQAQQIATLKQQVQTLQTTITEQASLLSNYKTLLNKYQSSHRSNEWEVGAYGGYLSGGTYGIGVQRNIKSKYGVSVIVLSGEHTGALVGLQVMF